MALISEQEIAADNGTWLTYPTHLDTELFKSGFAADTTL